MVNNPPGANPFGEAAAQYIGDSFTEDLLRSSLRAAEAHYFPGAHPRLIVQTDGPMPPDAATALALSIAAAATLFTTGRDMFSAGPPQPHHDEHGNRATVPALLSPLAVTSHTLLFAIATTAPTPDPGPAVADWCPGGPECAIYQLCSTLPASADDELTVAAIASLPRPQRRAVALLAAAVADLDRCVSVEVDGAVGTDHAVLSRAHARALRAAPDIDRPREIVTATGILDADRTRRRTFYLSRPEGDLHGSVDDDVLPRLPELITRRITVRLEHALPGPDHPGTTDIYRLLGIVGTDATTSATP
ncbi:hypothetical protein [Nocardia sp. NPDC051570]|uniref:hypothetical protein n=1 Tax=Nocardia sp. NPDC051570 TaxID=3364324 RepID=UPI0037A9AFEA